MPRPAVMLATLSCLVLLAACGEAAPEWAGSVDTMGSGVVVVTNPAEGVWEPGETWRLEEELRIGSAMSEGPDLFGFVGGLAVDRQGQIHVLDRRANEIRTFDSAGAHVRTFGREGAGPGELSNPLGMVFGPGGRLWVADPQNARYSVFTGDGAFVTSHLRPLSGSSSPWNGGFGPEGRLHEQIPASGRFAVVRLDSSFESTDTVFFPEYDVPELEFNTESMRLRAGIPFATSQQEYWDPRGYLWTGVTGTYALTRMDMSGDTLRIIYGPPMDPIPVTDQEREQALERLQWFTRQGGEVRASDIPSEKPPIGTFHVAGDHLWVRLTNAADQEGVRYHVLDGDGVFLGTVETPRGLGYSPLFSGDHIYTVIADTLGVQYVVRYGVERGGPDLEG